MPVSHQENPERYVDFLFLALGVYSIEPNENFNENLKMYAKTLIYISLFLFLMIPGYGFETVLLEKIGPGTTSPTGAYRWRDAADYLYAESYRNSYDYDQAVVQIHYTTDENTLFGTLVAANLKPNFAYQMKLVGTSGTTANEFVGLAGRWWQEEWNGTAWASGQNLNNKGDGTSPNPNYLIYFERVLVSDPSSPTGRHYRFTGYLVFDYFITDDEGDAVFDFVCSSSYHVLWKTTQRTATAADGPVKSRTFDPDPNLPAYDTDYGESVISIFGEWERLPIGGLQLSHGSYDISFVLTEESFHSCSVEYSGCWAGAMAGSVYFTIPMCIVDLDDFAQFSREWFMVGAMIPFDLNDSNSVNLADTVLFSDPWLRYCPADWPLSP
jgi:hypothetical protein